MTVDHEQLVLDAAAAILRARGEGAKADAILGKRAVGQRGRASTYEPGPDATVLQRRVYERMRASGRNQYSLAKEAGLGDDFVREIFRGRNKDPGALRMSKLAKVLNCSIEYLIGENDEP